MPETRFVVEVSEPVPGELVGQVAGRIAGRFAMDERRVRKLVEDRTGPVTRPLPKDKADRIARAFTDAGVAVRVRPDVPDPSAAEPGVPGASEAGSAEGESVPGAPRQGGSERAGSAASSPAAPSGRPTPAPPGGSYDEPPNVFLSSTRWVPSPHEEPEAAEDHGALVEGTSTSVPVEPEAPRRGALGDPAEGGAAGLGSPGSNPPRPKPPRSDPPGPSVTRSSPPRAGAAAASGPGALRGPRLRRGLLIGFLLALLLLLALQLLVGLRGGSAPPTTMDAGMRAYGNGDFAEARRVWTPLAQGGNARAQYMLGYMDENGQGRAWSNHDAADWYRRASDQHYPQAQVALGQLYARGMGVERDATRAADLFEAAAKEGYGPGQFQYALALFHGTGVPQDFEAALTWFEAAAANGVAEARPYVAFAGSAAQKAPGTAAGGTPTGGTDTGGTDTAGRTAPSGGPAGSPASP